MLFTVEYLRHSNLIEKRSVMSTIFLGRFSNDGSKVCATVYCETHKTMNTRNIYGMLLCCEKLANKACDN